ncbi:hypothetical protein ASD06_11595 [Angustibacter sp. Root456]|nr:hypothetical protein ASD06_11595 [Angustibacter sp. Root456]
MVPSPTPSPRPTESTGLRAAIEAASHPLLVRLAALPRAVPFVALLALLVVGVFVGGVVGVVCTALVALFVAWLMYLSWPRLTGVERLGRAAVLLIAVALVLVEAFPPR